MSKVKTLSPREIGQMISISNIATLEFALACAEEYTASYDVRNRDKYLIASKFLTILEYVNFRNSLYGDSDRPGGYRSKIIDTDGVNRSLDELDALIPTKFSALTIPACVTLTGEPAYDSFQVNLLDTKGSITYICDYLALAEAGTWLNRNIKRDGNIPLGMSSPLTQKASDVIVRYGVKCGPNTDKATIPVKLRYTFYQEEYYSNTTAIHCYDLFKSLFK